MVRLMMVGSAYSKLVFISLLVTRTLNIQEEGETQVRSGHLHKVTVSVSYSRRNS